MTTYGKPQPRSPGLNRRNPLSRGVVAAYPFWTLSSLELRDVSGNGWHLPWSGTNLPATVGSSYGFAADFAGGNTNDIWNTDFGTDIFDGSSATVLALCRPEAANGVAVQIVGSGGAGERVCELLFTSGTAFSNTNNYLIATASAGGQPINVWYLWIVRWDFGRQLASLWINGVEIATDTSFNDPVNPQEIAIGARQNLQREWTGQIGNTIIWDRYLSDIEMVSVSTDPFGIYRFKRRVPLFSAGVGVAITPAEIAAATDTYRMPVGDLDEPVPVGV